MESFLHSVASVTIILLLTLTGYFCAARGWTGAQSKAFVSKFLMRVAIPGSCINGLTKNLTREMIMQSGRLLSVPFLNSVILFALAYVAARLLKVPHRRMGPFLVMFSLSNCIFIGYAMCSELFGEECTPPVMLYFLVSSSFTQLVGLTLIRWSGESAGAVSLKKAVCTFFQTPTVLAILTGFAIVLSGLRLPPLVGSYIRYLDNIVSPLALVLTGQIIHEIGLCNLRLDRQQAVILLARFILAPTMCIFLCSLLGVDGLSRSVFVIEAAMPVVTQTVVASAEYGADERFAAQGAAISTIACFAVIPVLMLLL